MTTTTTMTVAPPVTTTTTLTTTLCCPKCGYDIAPPAFEETQAALLDAHNKINDLQAQVRLLNQKASAAIDRWADYEDELANLRAQLETQQQQQQQQQHQHQQQQPPPSVSAITPLQTPSPARSSFLPAGAATRLSAFLSPRTKSAPAAAAAAASAPPTSTSTTSGSNNNNLRPHTRGSSNPSLLPSQLLGSPLPIISPGLANANANNPLVSPAPSTESLLEALSREQALRLEAEGRLSETSREVEELSVSLFEQANEMVAAERRARARLEERVETLEKREGEKKRRLERLEGAVRRIERVRGLLAEDGGGE